MSGCRAQLLSDVPREWRTAQEGFDTLSVFQLSQPSAELCTKISTNQGGIKRNSKYTLLGSAAHCLITQISNQPVARQQIMHNNSFDPTESLEWEKKGKLCNF